MDAETVAHWRAADALFDQWLDLPVAGRDRWLEEVDAPDPVLHRLGQLVAAHLKPRSALDRQTGDLAGRTLGDWTLESELGRGGMAVVHRAWRAQGMARQSAAVKVLTMAALGAGGRERFQREAGILARLNHPNITALVDSGVADDGTCWLAMPLVEGERIDQWCHAGSLDARAIIRLYLQVCGAVAFAHRSLVIHRDIKPSNVMVGDEGQVHLLDFGIGQFTDAPGERTHTLWRVLTPGYAAPEQLRGDPPSTAIDVYGLGALLHRLLTGRTPQAGTESRSSDTTRPSLLVRDVGDAYHRHYVPLKNDLDRVLLKALAEEPEQRYRTAEALADDLRRWLDGRPVLAQKPKLGYRLRKFVTRNRVGVAAGVLLAASLGAGVGATLWQADVARREAANATAQAKRAVLVRDFLMHVFESTEPASGGIPTALELLDEGARRARSNVLATDPMAAADILMLTGKARLTLNQIDKGQADLEQARELFAAGNEPAYGERSIIESELSSLMRYLGKGDIAIEQARTAVALGELALAETGDPEPVVEARIRLAEALFADDPNAATGQLEQVVQSLPGYGLQNTRLHLSALSSLSVTASISSPQDHDRHTALSERLIDMSRRINGADSAAYANVLANQAQTFLEADDYDRAEQLAFDAVELVDRIHDQPHTGKALAHCSLGVILHTRGRTAEAAGHYAVADNINDLLGAGNLSAESCYRNSGYAHLVLGEHQTAFENLERSWEILGERGWRSSVNGQLSCGFLATARLKINDVEGASEALAGCPVDKGAADIPLARRQAQAELHFARGEFEEAVLLASEARRVAPPESGDPSWMRPWMLSLLLAHTMGDDGTIARLQSELGPHAALEPLSHCLADPGEANCLALP